MYVSKSHMGSLEQKLDSLVSLIKSTQDPELQGIDQSQRFQPSVSGSTASTQYDPTSPQGITAAQIRLPDNLQEPSSDMNTVVPNFVEANLLLTFFRDEMIPKFPFIALPQGISAEDLYRTRPFLYISILAVAVRDNAQQIMLGKHVMRQLAEKMFVSGERSLDLLQGILTYGGWCYHHLTNFPQLTSLLSAGLTLIHDLSLHRPLPKVPSSKTPWEEALYEMCAVPGYPPKTVRTLDEQRSLLGFYFLSSMRSSFCRRVETMQIYSSYIQECARDLELSRAVPGDVSAAALVRQQIILERIHQTSWQRKWGVRELEASTMVMLQAFEQQMKQHHQNLPPLQAKNVFIHIQFYATQISLYEAGLCNSRKTNEEVSSFTRLKLLCSSLDACKSYFEAFFSIPATDYMTMAMPTWPSFRHSLANLLALSTYENADWNLALVRESVDFIAVMDQTIKRLESVSSLPGNGKTDMFSRTATAMDRVKIFLDEKIFKQARTAPQNADQTEGFDLPNRSEDLSQFFDFLDDTLMGDIMGPIGSPDYQSHHID